MNTWTATIGSFFRSVNLVIGLITFLISGNRGLTQGATVAPGPSSISAGQLGHAMLIKTDGSLWTWGANDYGQLGDGTTIDSALPLRVATNGPTNVIAVSGGYTHSLALASDSRVWAWGEGDVGEIGNGQWADSSQPLLVSGLTNISAIASGGYHSLAISNGFVWAWGFNWDGELGNGTKTHSAVPVRANGLTNITAIAGGNCHSLALSDGTVWGFGDNRNGALGAGSNVSTASNAVKVAGLANVTKIAAGAYHSLAVSNGSVWAWGENDGGQLGDYTTIRRYTPVLVLGLSNVVDIAAGDTHSLALKSDGTAWGWGAGISGQLNDGTITKLVPGPFSVAGLKQITAISAGGGYAILVQSNQTVWTAGLDDYGQRGDDFGVARRGSLSLVMGASVAVTPGAPNQFVRNTRFERGFGSDKTFVSFVIPLDGQKGVKLNSSGGNADVLFKTNMWTSVLSHLDRSGPGVFPFKNPIVAFGSRVSGTPLYYNQSYNFGVYAGDVSVNPTNAISI